MLYVLYINSFDIPFTFGNESDSPHIFGVDSILNKIGYIRARRYKENGAQENFVNSALLGEIINKNNLTMLFNNETRQKGGKFSKRPLTPETAINWLLEAYQTANPDKQVYVVPMSCGYTRVFDMKNIVDGGEFGLKQTYKTISALKSGQLGKVFVKFGEPISIKNFLAS